MILARRANAIEPTLIRALRDEAGPRTLDLGLGQPDLPVPEPLRAAVAQEIAAGRAPYSPNLGLPTARAAVGERYGVDASRVMLTCGVQQALAVAILGLVEPGDDVLVPDPGFPAYPNLVRMAGATPRPYRLAADDGFALSEEALLEALTPNTSLVVFNSPANPTGAVTQAGALDAILAALAERGVRWLSDEIYEDYDYDNGFASVLDVRDEALGLKLGGLSKSFHTMGWRMGWLLGDDALIEGLKPLHQHLVTCAPVPAQRATIVAMQHHRALFAPTLEVFSRRRALAVEQINAVRRLTCAAPPGAFYLFVDVREYTHGEANSLELARRLLAEQDVLVIPGSGFGPGGEGFLRVAYTVGEDVLREALGRIKDFFEG